MMRRHFITGEWEEVDDDLSGTYVVRDGQVIKSSPRRERSSRAAICSKNPWTSRSLGVNPEHAAEYQRELTKAGVNATVGVDGHPTVTSRDARNKLMEYQSRITGENFIDRDGGYGDRT